MKKMAIVLAFLILITCIVVVIVHMNRRNKLREKSNQLLDFGSGNIVSCELTQTDTSSNKSITVHIDDPDEMVTHAMGILNSNNVEIGELACGCWPVYCLEIELDNRTSYSIGYKRHGAEERIHFEVSRDRPDGYLSYEMTIDQCKSLIKSFERQMGDCTVVE